MMFGKNYDIGQSKASAVIDAPIEKINLGDWMFTITTDEYAACSTGHQSAAQGVMPDGKRLSINVERIGEAQIVQHYIEQISERDHVLGVSPNSSVWVNGRLASIEVHWSLKARRVNDTQTEITCLVKNYSPSWLMARVINSQSKKFPKGQSPVDLHIKEEAPLFAKDVERKANAGRWS